jgi:hypothetical protein
MFEKVCIYTCAVWGTEAFCGMIMIMTAMCQECFICVSMIWLIPFIVTSVDTFIVGLMSVPIRNGVEEEIHNCVFMSGLMFQSFVYSILLSTSSIIFTRFIVKCPNEDVANVYTVVMLAISITTRLITFFIECGVNRSRDQTPIQMFAYYVVVFILDMVFVAPVLFISFASECNAIIWVTMIGVSGLMLVISGILRCCTKYDFGNNMNAFLFFLDCVHVLFMSIIAYFVMANCTKVIDATKIAPILLMFALFISSRCCAITAVSQLPGK